MNSRREIEEAEVEIGSLMPMILSIGFDGVNEDSAMGMG
jgi:hypothetical protein